MAKDARERLPHIRVDGYATTEPYTYPRPVRVPSVQPPARDRLGHGNRLLAELDGARAALVELNEQRRVVGVVEDRGMYLEFESEPGFELVLRSLDRRIEDIELVAVREIGRVTFATVFVGEGKLKNLERLVRAYLTEETYKGQPKNQRLVESIRSLRQAVLESFWTDDAALLPNPGTTITWEVWLRAGEDPDAVLKRFGDFTDRVGMELARGIIRFTDRTVRLARGTREQMQASIELLDCVAELRLAKETPAFFTRLPPREQAEWVTELGDRTQFASDSAPAVCLLDTGVNRGHPLLVNAIGRKYVLTCDPAWGVADHDGHGTEMAGLGLFGDLVDPLLQVGPVELEHALESVKVLPPPSHPPNQPELYGSLTLEAMGRIEVAAPHRGRAYCLTVMAPDDRDRGKPSSWSAAIDTAAVGIEDDNPRLVVLAAGNVDRPNWRYYPDQNDTDQVHDPGQAWNALTVGAFTEKVAFDPNDFPGWEPVARPGGLSPSSTTSVTWADQWPNKPDLVLEGGNGIREPGTGLVDADDSLSLLTLHWQPIQRLLSASGDTSAAAAQAARLAAILMARYTDLWPETVRGLLVHSADWTEEMLRSTQGLSPSRRAGLLLRRYGYGVPSLDRACWSAHNALTLLAQRSLRPFEKPSTRVRTKDMSLHALPWPRDELLSLGGTPVELRVTLSYFVEPNPARRGWIRKFSYQSHGLRFAIRAPGEDLDNFRARVTKDAQDEERGFSSPDDSGWAIGPRQRDRGSIHSDRWHGIAADLADRYHIAVYPVGGWWKERPHLERWDQEVRYALIVSIGTPSTEVDIYTPVATRVAVPVAIAP